MVHHLSGHLRSLALEMALNHHFLDTLLQLFLFLLLDITVHNTKSQYLCHLRVDAFGGGSRCPSVYNIALLVDEELLKVPLREGLATRCKIRLALLP